MKIYLFGVILAVTALVTGGCVKQKSFAMFPGSRDASGARHQGPVSANDAYGWRAAPGAPSLHRPTPVFEEKFFFKNDRQKKRDSAQQTRGEE